MEYFAGLDVSMAETHVCVVTRNGNVVHEAKENSIGRWRSILYRALTGNSGWW